MSLFDVTQFKPVSINPVVLYKTADQIVSNSTTLVNVPDLALEVPANSKYAILMWLIWISSSVADMKFGWSAPASGVLVWGASATTSDIVLAVGDILNPNGSVNNDSTHLTAYFANSSTAGTLQFKFAQNTAEVSDSKILIGSHIVAYRLA